MNTQVLGTSDEELNIAAQLLKDGEVVAIPTETVYGLAADALCESAVRKIFAAKNRPCDNPLIVHVCSIEMAKKAVSDFPAAAMKCAEKYWPGPLTMVLPKSRDIPFVTSGGLDTVGIRFPSNPVARKIIEKCGLPLAAPSANISGSPSPTTAKRVFEDMNNKISAIVDGGESEVGVESTVISFEGDGVRILRPGKISYEDLLSVCDSVYIDNGVLNELNPCDTARSPGMKYKHYSPKAEVILVDSDIDSFKKYVSDNNDGSTYCLLFCDGEAIDGIPYLTYGADSLQQAHFLFERLRQFDELGAAKVFVRCPEKSGVGLAVYNRVLRSAGFNVVKLRSGKVIENGSF